MSTATEPVSVRMTEQGQPSVEQRILALLEADKSQTFEQVAMLLPDVSWSQVFLAIDRLSRSGQVVLRKISGRDYRVSLNRTRPDA
ncbi:MAG: hypothetical protein HY205_07400 [Nitrospirae bacterium]|nr:hypothetical protein [Nitrospirota bacterium]